MALLTPEIVFRRYATIGVPDSGLHEPRKDEIIQLLNLLFGVSRGGWVVTKTREELLGVVPEASTDGGVVLNDRSPGWNGHHQWDVSAGMRPRLPRCHCSADGHRWNRQCRENDHGGRH